ncbi:dihydrofolate reductase family protein [Mucilaginibacter gilvus]|uniref:Dihydrofolate reductase n=1 Tax=Mucilaginibacter gilvus TaxID=2305909 RepID=A0A3S3USV8_9SPHI|nr:dihydrofolate reductase family protein [Mucilaginibacter gilvus]RWY47345.1 dihydrofolate reductase [Mucilaginibacter gilvus]
MRKLVLNMGVTVDGFVAAPDGNQDWLFKVQEEGSNTWILDTIKNAGMHLMGSNVFNDMISYWPFSDEIYAEPMNTIPKAAFTRHKVNMEPNFKKGVEGFKMAGIPKTVKQMKATPGCAENLAIWQNALVIKGDLAHGIEQLKQKPGKYILAHGGSGFAQALTALDLVDEYRLTTYPVALGEGMPLFGVSPKPLELTLMQTHIFSNGVIGRVYVPKRK